MISIRESALATRVMNADLAITVSVNRGCQTHCIKAFFAGISRLGDGVFWYTLMLLLPLLFGADGLRTSAKMLVAGVIALAIYKFLKERTGRPRPCAVSTRITRGTAPLDEFSFPSGHTLHAVTFSLIACSAHPGLMALVVPFAVCVALSRVILGLHYASDVAAGAILGLVVVEVADAWIFPVVLGWMA